MLIAFSGLKGSGKDTAAAVMVEEYGFTKIAFADALREMALVIDPMVWADPDNIGGAVRLSDVVAQFGWDYSKRTYPEVRRLLQVIGTEAGRMMFGDNVWIKALTKKYRDIATAEARYVITDCRFDNEADFVHDAYGDVVWIDRPGLTSDGHSSESTSVRAKADYILHNDEDIANLQEDVRFLLFIKGVTPIE